MKTTKSACRTFTDDESCRNTIRVFVASSSAEWLAAKVLEFSIRETTSLPVDFNLMHMIGRAIPLPLAVQNRPRTPFSFQRFLIPELCGFSGRAIYLDSDMQVFQDIRELWEQDFEGHDLQTVKEEKRGRRGQFSVMLLDCKALRWNIEEIVADLDADRLDYEGLMYEMRVARKIGRAISPHWNSLEHYEEGKTALLHYTDMNTQPWISTTNPLERHWTACLRRSLQCGFLRREEVAREVAAGHVRPSLLAQIDVGLNASISLPRSVRILDRDFVAPYLSLKAGKGRPWTSMRSAAFQLLRRSYYRSPLARYFDRD